MKILFIIFLLFINLISSQIIQKNCFNINDQFVLIENNQKILQINGKGIMCDCDTESFQFQSNKEEIKIIQFSNEITQIGKQCFQNFIHVTQIQFNQTSQIK